MASFNKVILSGNLTRDPQFTTLPSGTGVCEFGLAVNRKWRGKDGNMSEEVTFVDCSCFSKLAETASKYLNKGKNILIEGRLKLDQWEGKDGGNRSKLTVVADNIIFLSSGKSEGDNGYEPAAASQPQQDDIPF